MCIHCVQHRPIPRNTGDNFYKPPERETKGLHMSGSEFFLTAILEARRQESKAFKVLKGKISTIFCYQQFTVYQLKQYFQVCKILKYLFPMCISQGVSGRCHSNKIRGKKTKIWHIGIQGGKDPRKETGKGNTRNVSSAPDLRIVSPETDIEGCQYQDSYCCYASRPPKLVWSRFFFALI